MNLSFFGDNVKKCFLLSTQPSIKTVFQVGQRTGKYVLYNGITAATFPQRKRQFYQYQSQLINHNFHHALFEISCTSLTFYTIDSFNRTKVSIIVQHFPLCFATAVQFQCYVIGRQFEQSNQHENNYCCNNYINSHLAYKGTKNLRRNLQVNMSFDEL